jgi:hypothetical protein
MWYEKRFCRCGVAARRCVAGGVAAALRQRMCRSVVCVLLVVVLGSLARGADFAAEVVSFQGPFGSSPYDDPNSVLGKPTTEIYDSWSFEIFACSLVYPAWGTDPNDNKLITILGEGAEIVVKFDHKVADDPGNPYGVDFIVFGNAFFESVGWVGSDTDMEEFFLKDPTGVYAEPVLVSVSQDGETWYTYSDGPFGNTAFPTNAYAWDRQNHCWGEELDWTRPIDPNVKVADFDGLSAADAIDLYGGSAGGTGFDLKVLDPNDYAALAVDSGTGRKWIQYVKVHGSAGGRIDGFADAAGCGDYQHLYPVGDINKDCRVDMRDFATFVGHWMDCTWDCP